MARQEIDPHFPWIQVDRGVGPKAAQLASAIEVTYQHARGSLEVLWETLADRRVLAELIRAGKKELVLSEDQVDTYLELAFGKKVPKRIMVALGFFEEKPDGLRARGMSRYINAEAARLLKKRGGKGGGRSEAESGQHPGATPVPPVPHPDGTPEATPVPPHRGKREELRGKSLKEEEAPTPEQKPLYTPLDIERVNAEALALLAGTKARGADHPVVPFHAWAQEQRRERHPQAIEDHRRAGAEAWYERATQVPGVTDARLRGGWLAYLEDPYGQSRKPICSFQVFMADDVWRRCVEAAIASEPEAAPRPTCSVEGCRRGAETATWGEHPLCLQHHGTWSNSPHLPPEPRPETEAEFRAFLTSLAPTEGAHTHDSP